jgi:hypothetical protein
MQRIVDGLNAWLSRMWSSNQPLVTWQRESLPKCSRNVATKGNGMKKPGKSFLTETRQMIQVTTNSCGTKGTVKSGAILRITFYRTSAQNYFEVQ